MPSESDDDRLFLDGQDRRSGLLRSRRHIRDGGPPFPLGDRLLIDSVALRQRSQARLTMLYRSTDRLCRCGASMKHLAHSASFESLDKNAPSKVGTKQLVRIVNEAQEHDAEDERRMPVAVPSRSKRGRLDPGLFTRDRI